MGSAGRTRWPPLGVVASPKLPEWGSEAKGLFVFLALRLQARPRASLGLSVPPHEVEVRPRDFWAFLPCGLSRERTY